MGVLGQDATTSLRVGALAPVNASGTLLNDTNGAQTFPSDSSQRPRRGLKREISNMSDVEVSTSAVRLKMRRVRGKQPTPEAFVTVAPSPVDLGESTPSFLPPNFRPCDGVDFFQELYHQYGIDVIKYRKVDRKQNADYDTGIFFGESQGLL